MPKKFIHLICIWVVLKENYILKIKLKLKKFSGQYPISIIHLKSTHISSLSTVTSSEIWIAARYRLWNPRFLTTFLSAGLILFVLVFYLLIFSLIFMSNLPFHYYSKTTASLSNHGVLQGASSLQSSVSPLCCLSVHLEIAASVCCPFLLSQQLSPTIITHVLRLSSSHRPQSRYFLTSLSPS